MPVQNSFARNQGVVKTLFIAMDNPNLAPFVEAEQVQQFIDELSGSKDGQDDWTCLSLYELRERYRQFTGPHERICVPSVSRATASDGKPALQIFTLYHQQSTR